MHSRPVHVIAVLATVLCCSVASAGSLHWGPRAGVNLSAFSGEFGDLVRPDVRVFPNVGLALQVDLARNVSFRTEAAYSVKGGGSASEGTDPYGNPTGTFKDTWRFDYLEIPLLFRTRMPLGASVSPYLEVGPAVAVALAGKFTSAGVSVDLRGQMEPVDMGFGGGFGIEFPVGRTQASLELRYGRGFNGLMKGSGPSIINQAWTIATCWLY